jgi:hypothetical protein
MFVSAGAGVTGATVGFVTGVSTAAFVGGTVAGDVSVTGGETELLELSAVAGVLVWFTQTASKTNAPSTSAAIPNLFFIQTIRKLRPLIN